MKLTGILADIAEATDEATALKIADAFGGLEINVPGVQSLASGRCSENEFVAAIGLEAATKIAKVLFPHHTCSIAIPFGPTSHRHQRRAEIVSLIEAGKSVRTIVGAMRCSSRTVARIRAELARSRSRKKARPAPHNA